MAAFDFIKSMFGKLDDIVYEPVKTACRRFEAPLVQQKHDHKMEVMDAQGRQKQADSELAIALKRSEAEIEEIRRDGELARHKDLHDAVLSYQERLIDLRNTAFSEAGDLHLDLVKKANALIDERHQRLTAFMEQTRSKTFDELESIDTRFANNPARQDMLAEMVMNNVRNVLNQAETFISDLTQISRNLNEGIARLNVENTKLLASQGDHLEALGAYFTPAGTTGGQLGSGSAALPQADPARRLAEGEK